MDEKFLEMAECLTLAEVTAGLAKARITQTRPDGFDGTCTCGEEIPFARVALGYYNCVGCQGRKERR
jgi:hypothetical protein